MDLSIIKSEINKALSQSHAKGFTYNDLFILYKDQDEYYRPRVHNSSLQEFETEYRISLNKVRTSLFISNAMMLIILVQIAHMN